VTKSSRITVVVPTRNRPESLERCLGHVAAQEIDEPIEILVVDDASDEAGLVADVVARIAAARVIRQPRKGPAAARNTGARAASGSIICFTDDDCEPQPGWLAGLARALEGERIVAGVTLNGGPDNPFALASELVGKYFREHSSVPFAASNNLATSALLAREFPFDESFVDAAGEDRDWCQRVAAGGYRIAREPGAVVVHHEPMALRAFVRQHARYGRGSYHYHRAASDRRRLERPHFYTNVVARGFTAGPSVGLLVAVAQLATGFGYFGEWIRARRRFIR
jgi:glycosyltransferase involved in cell wall biosynthesis